MLLAHVRHHRSAAARPFAAQLVRSLGAGARAARRALLLATALAVLSPLSAWAAGAYIAGSGEGTGEKPQSKLWYNDGCWWGMVHKAGQGLHFYEFDGADWRECSFMDAELGASGAADVKWNGQELFVLAYSSHPQLFAYTYDRSLRVYNLEPGFPVPIPIASGSETMVLDQDSTGRLWASYEGDPGGLIYVCWSTSPDHRQWYAPGLVIRSGVKDDDISSVVAFDQKIGVFWSDQVHWKFEFRVHRDGDPPDVWQPVETVRTGSGCSDDHINIKADGSGNVYAVTKDINDKMSLHVRNVATGKWSTKTGVISGTGTRGNLLLCDADRTMYVAYTVWSSSALDVGLRKASYATRSFSTVSSKFIDGATMNNCTSTKQVLPRGCYMVLAEGGGHTWWNGWGTVPPDGPQPPAPPDSVRAGLLSQSTGSHNGGQMALDLRFDEGAGTSTADASPAANPVTLAAVAGKNALLPSWTAGHSGTALRFDGVGSYIQIPSTAELRIPGSFTLEAWLRWDGAASLGTLVNKGKSSHRNYQVQVRSDGRIEFRWYTSGGTSRVLTSTTALPVASWHHVACAYDLGAQRGSLWIDGRMEASAAQAGTPAVTDDPVLLGMRYSSTTPTEFLAGALDEVRIWQGALFQGDFDPFDPPRPHHQYEVSQSVQISWQPSDLTQLLTYRVYRSANGGPRQRLTPEPLAATSYIDAAPISGNLCYEVAAVDTLLREGRTSPSRCVGFGTQTPPISPDLSKASALPGPHLAMRAHPNPFNPQTQLSVEIPEAGWVHLEIYDVAGRRVAMLQNGTLPAGEHRFDWNPGRASHLGSGVYFARLQAAGRSLHEKLIVIK